MYHYIIISPQGQGMFYTKQEAMEAAQWQSQFSNGTIYQGNFDRNGIPSGRFFRIFEFNRLQ